MKPTFKTLATIVCLLCSIAASAHDFMINGIYYDIIDSDSYTVKVTYKGNSFIDYPDVYTGMVVIPETVTKKGTTYSVTSIGAFAFWGCEGLTEVTIPNSVTSIGESAFDACYGLTEVTIPSSVTSIGERAFCGCTELISIVVEKGNTVYDSRENCNAIIETTTNTLITGCKNTIIPNSVTTIGDAAFSGCPGLTEVTIPNSVTTIGESAFRACDGLTELTIGDSVTSIGKEAFSNCDGLTEVILSNSVADIGDGAFFNCRKLTYIIIPKYVTWIGEHAFECCNIKDVYAYPTEPPTIYDNTFDAYNTTLHTAKGYKDVYAEAPYWDYFVNITDDLVAGIEGVKANDAFSVTVVGGTLAITGAADDAVVNIYNTNGALLHHTTVAQASGIALPNGIYLVQVNGVTKKVAL